MPIIDLGVNPDEPKVLGFLKDVWGIDDLTIDDKTKNVKDVTNRKALHKDIVQIVLFLADKPRVKRNLAALNKAIVLKLEKQPDLLKNLEDAVKKGTTVDIAKTNRMMTGVLGEFESDNEFNNGSNITLQSTSQLLGDGTAKIGSQDAWRDYNPSKATTNLPRVTVPSEAPTITGQLALSFNPVLLKNGFHWKDPGVQPNHGEFAHRLQWFAIVTACKNGELALANKPIQVFKSMGYDSFSRVANDGGKGAKTTYLWMLCCDNVYLSNILGSEHHPRSGTFGCPEIFNMDLCDLTHDLDNKSGIEILKILLAKRYAKREANKTAAIDKILELTKGSKMMTTTKGDQGVIAWVKRN